MINSWLKIGVMDETGDLVLMSSHLMNCADAAMGMAMERAAKNLTL